ncbi:hypothetical protein AUEXF2481DRAFT_46007 [Aureobasidium subglaciale EXF-2481]|uniref:3-hydroxyisobutyrate dehydrogenase n=1 Tax=Aureobasidium subglaciale (strain EXF-2481) TaxID=1043005 RepID=A0A074YK34_AURSE|nr:uncharacterized protein AUEXF2481DRAFT_46007 [Aureobasidium subglaciale EXF-2481]KEQ98128.1 hypothetical protein AUEXF2481DRAFT_46007 [Aureobasidium subglaciale EXF-2481]
MASSSIRSFGFVGLGLMGKPMSMNLASKMEDHQHLYIYDLAKSVVSEVCESNPQRITRCQSAKEVAEKADFIITMLPEGKHVKTVYIDGAINLCSTDLSGKTLVDCSTIDAATTLLVKNHIKQHFPDTPFYDAPVSGGTVGAIKATIAFFLDCSEADQNLPLLQAILGTMGKEIIPCGGPSLGIVSKLCNNYLSGSITIASSEAFDMGIRAGVDPKVLYKVFGAGTGQNTIVDKWCPVPGIVPEAPSSKGIQLMLKDYTLATQMADSLESRPVLGQAGLEAWREASDDSRFYDLDSRMMYQYIKSRAEDKPS